MSTTYEWDEAKAMAKATEYGIPFYMTQGLKLWVIHGPESCPGDFLTAVISNDLKKACWQADDSNIRLLPEYVKWFYNWAPSPCWGSPEAFKTWKGIKS